MRGWEGRGSEEKRGRGGRGSIEGVLHRPVRWLGWLSPPSHELLDSCLYPLLSLSLLLVVLVGVVVVVSCLTYPSDAL